MILDTNVLVYAVGGEHPLRRPAQRLLNAVESGGISATTSVLVIQEFIHVYARRGGQAAAVGAARAYVDLLEPLLPAEQILVGGALNIVASFSLRSTDALIAATAIHEARTLVSADRDFSRVLGLNLIYPDEEGVARVLDR